MTENQWASALYESKHSFVWRYGADCLDLLSPQQGDHILDLGCGTGQLTAKIAAFGAEVLGIDKALTMIEQARKNYSDLQFEVADATNFHFGQFDAVFSNATLHWIKEPEQVITCIWQSLKPGGRFVAEFGGKGNIRAIVAAINNAIETVGYPAKPELNPWYFPSIGEYTTLLEKQGFCVTYAILFERPTPLEDGEKGIKNWIEMFAESFLQKIPVNQRISVIQEIENQLRPELYRDGTWFADYKRIRVVATKE